MNNPTNQGFIALITAILMSALLMAITLTQSRTVFFLRAELQDSENKQQSRALAQSCVHEAILRLTLDSAYAGNEEITIADQKCTIKTIENFLTSKVIQTQANMQNRVTDLKVEVSTPEYAIISSTEEFP